jgi:tRNA nucleotidyltransferase (CCA-adding enzyme)
MAPVQLYKSQAGPAAVRRLALRVGRLDLLAKLVLCDQRGRPPIEANEVPAVQWLQKTAGQLDVAAQKPRAIILGRHLLALGVKPGPQMGALLKQLFDAQLDGRFSTVEEGVNFAKMLLAEKTKPPQQKA